MATDAQKRAYLDEMVRQRGYVLPYHKALVAADYDLMVKANDLIAEAYLRPRRLDRATKELLFILSLVVMRASRGHIQSHIRVALELGVSPEEILEAIEISLPEAGVVAFQDGFEAWRETVGLAGIEPSDADPPPGQPPPHSP